MVNKYYEKFKEKNDEKIHQKKICEVCGGSYTYFNKSKHNKTKKHLLGVLKKENPENEILKKL